MADNEDIIGGGGGGSLNPELKMADNEDIIGGGGGSLNPESKSTDDKTAAAVIPGAEEVTAENSSSCDSDPHDIIKQRFAYIFELKNRLTFLKISDNIDPQVQQPPREPASRNFPPGECLCFRKKLTLTDASHVDGKLEIEDLKAIWIPGCPEIPKEAHDMRKSVELNVYDYENRLYKMVLTGYNYEGIVLYSINGEWRKFIRAHNLQHGDMIFFCRNIDPKVSSHDYYYVILFARKSDGNFLFLENVQDSTTAQ